MSKNLNTIKKITFICPRYLTNHAGGAETLTRKLAIKSQENGYQVELLSTCAVNHYSWENELEEKTFRENGITIRLFKIDTDRDTSRFGEFTSAVILTSPFSVNFTALPTML